MPPSEKAVRKQEIDRALAGVGWRVVSYARWAMGDRTAAVNIARQRADAKRVDQALLARAFRGKL